MTSGGQDADPERHQRTFSWFCTLPDRVDMMFRKGNTGREMLKLKSRRTGPIGGGLAAPKVGIVGVVGAGEARCCL